MAFFHFQVRSEVNQRHSAGEKNFLTRDITLLFVQHCVNFSSKSKATKHILKSEARDKLIQPKKTFLSCDSKELIVQRFA